MNAGDERTAAQERRERARRALAEADAAVTRLRETRRRAEELLRRAAGELIAPADAAGDVVTPEDALRTRMRQIEDRMQETDSRMRTTEADVNRTGARMSDVRTERDR